MNLKKVKCIKTYTSSFLIVNVNILQYKGFLIETWSWENRHKIDAKV